MPHHKIAYLELPATDTGSMKTFYGRLFGWSFQDWGAEYTAFEDAGLDGGFNADPGEHKTSAPLVVIQTDDIETTAAAVLAAGGEILVPTFAYPGGRRFHFRDPSGNELAVMQAD